MEKEICAVKNIQPVNSLSQASGLLSASKRRAGIEERILNEKISNIIIVLGIPAHVKGYFYFREAIKLAVGNIEMISSIMKKLYPLVASRFNTSTGCVERGIRNAIEIAWNKGKIININSVLGLVVYERNDKPTSGELIALIAEKIQWDNHNAN